MEVGALRISIASLAFLPFVIKHLKDVPWDKLKYFIIVGLTGSGVPAFLFAIAQSKVDSSVAGLLNSLTPIFTLIIGLLVFGASLITKQVLGILFGFLGAATVILLQNQFSIDSNIYYGGLVVLATMCYGTSVNVVNYKLGNLSPTMISSISFLIIGPFALFYLLTTDVISDIQNHQDGLVSLLAVTTLSLLSTFYSTIVFYKLVHRTNPIFSASVSFLIPIVALFWAFLDGETVNLMHFISLAFILFGIYLIRIAKQDKSTNES